jgi:hypothetical protein
MRFIPKNILFITVFISFFSLDLINATITGDVVFEYPDFIKVNTYLNKKLSTKKILNLSKKDKFLFAKNYPDQLSKEILNTMIKDCPMFLDFIGYNISVFPVTLISKVDISKIKKCQGLEFLKEEIIFEKDDSSNVAFSIRNSLNYEQLKSFKQNIVKNFGKVSLRNNSLLFYEYLNRYPRDTEDVLEILSYTSFDRNNIVDFEIFKRSFNNLKNRYDYDFWNSKLGVPL